jgi:hypothetical protein
MNITQTELQHMVNFLTTQANWKVSIFEEGNLHWANTTGELLDNAQTLIKRYYGGVLDYATAMKYVTHYRYDDDCVNEGIEEQWYDYCKQQGILDFYFRDAGAYDYAA